MSIWSPASVEIRSARPAITSKETAITPDLESRLATAEDIARRSGDLLLTYFRTDRLDAQLKGQRDLVTAADTSSEHLILDGLRSAFPGDGIIAEEGGSAVSEDGLRWCVDPLDGTMNFARGLPMWCVSLSLFLRDEPILGVIHDPLRQQTFCAARGLGARRNGAPIRVSSVADPAQAFVHLTIDFDDRDNLTGIHDAIAVAPRVLRTRNFGSAALSLAYVSTGWLDAVLHRSANAWDYGAGAVLIQEAGGMVTGIDGEPYRLQTRTMAAACTSQLHQELVDLLRDPYEAS
jgi:myo-inositol-1(or 4)-monophosphatase